MIYIYQMKYLSLLLIPMLWLCSVSCDSNTEDMTTEDQLEEPTENPMIEPNSSALITGVTTSGQSGSILFNVTIKSPDTGCDQYADWWEVISTDGTELVYRRILGHSHVEEQPFTRSGTAPLDSDTEVIVRGHMNNLGYGNVVYRGSVATGFEEEILDEGFGLELATIEPLPDNCAF